MWTWVGNELGHELVPITNPDEGADPETLPHQLRGHSLPLSTELNCRMMAKCDGKLGKQINNCGSKSDITKEYYSYSYSVIQFILKWVIFMSIGYSFE